MVQDGRTIRWGIAGTGHIASRFATDIAHASGALLAGIASRDLERAQQFAARLPGVSAYGSLTKMADSPEIDAIYIASPNSAHLCQALECISAGKPVLIEKPLTATCEDARTLRDAAHKGGVFAMEAMWSRYLPAMRAAREHVASGALGPIRSLKGELAWNAPYDPASRLYDPASGGGALLDLGVYPVSLARYFLGEPDHVAGRWHAAPNGIDRAAEIELRFGHTEARLACGFDRHGDNRLIIEGENSTLVLGLPFVGAMQFGVFRSRRIADLLFPGEGRVHGALLRRLAGLIKFPAASVRKFPYPGTGLQFEIEAASNAIRKNELEEAHCTLDDSLKTLAIIEAIRANDPVT